MKERTFYHFLFWTGYVFFKTYLNFISSGGPDEKEPSLTFITMLVAQASFLLVKIPMVYCLFAIIDNYLSRQWRIMKSGIAVVVLFAAGIVVYMIINRFIVLDVVYKVPAEKMEPVTMGSIIYTFFMLCFVSGIAVAVKLIRYSILQKEQSQEIMKKKLEAELRFLKSQTNPHFLFNTLNNIYALARKKSDDTADVVMKLSKLLRFMLYESENESIPITNELKMIEDYINLEKIRYDDRLKVSYRQSIDNEMQLIAPLLLLPFVENAFKHGASESRSDSFINIDVTLLEGQLSFTIENPALEKDNKTGMKKTGLSNTSRQLELMYPEHLLKIENDNATFKVILKINLNKYAAV